MSASVLVQGILDEAASRWGDPNKGRIRDPEWIGFYNHTLEIMTRRYKILDQDASFDILANEDRYLYPDDCVQISRLRYSPTPADPLTFVEVHEIYEDRFRREVNIATPQGDTYFRYWARTAFFMLTPKPVTLNTDGGLISYWKLAVPLGTVTPSTLMEIPGMARGLVIDRMVIEADLRHGRMAAAQGRTQIWENEVSLSFEKIEDRSVDRRAQIRPQLTWGATEGMV